MSVRTVKAGTTDVSVTLRIIDSTDGTPETGVAFDTSGIDLWYRREGAVSTDITEATLADLTAAHSDGGFLHINDGVYRLDLPDAACASGVAGVQIGGTITGMVVLAPYIELPVNVEADSYGRLGAPAGASVSADIAAVKVDTAAILVDTAEIGVAGAGLTNINLPDQTMAITGNITGNLSGSVGSVTGAVGSIGTGGIAAASFAAGAIDAASIAANAIGASEIADGAIDAATFAAGAITATVIATGAIDADALAADAVDEILDETVGDGTITMRQALRILIAGMAAKLSGAATTTVTIRNLADSADVIVATVDADGNRTATTVTP